MNKEDILLRRLGEEDVMYWVLQTSKLQKMAYKFAYVIFL